MSAPTNQYLFKPPRILAIELIHHYQSTEKAKQHIKKILDCHEPNTPISDNYLETLNYLLKSTKST